MKVLVACEESQAICKAFREAGHEAYSCDVQPCTGGHPEWHIQEDIEYVLQENGEWKDDLDWDLMIAHPPCTYLSVAGAGWINRKPERKELMRRACIFFEMLWNAPIDKICIENPVIYKATRRLIGAEPAQTIEPYQFGEPYKKRTCLWLKNLPLLKPTKIVKPTTYWVNSSSNYRKGHKLSNKGIHRDKKNRAKTFTGIAKAMAQQWGNVARFKEYKKEVAGCNVDSDNGIPPNPKGSGILPKFL